MAAAGFAFLLAITPGLHAWLQDRRLAPLVDDPALPERLQSARQRSTIVFATCVAILLVVFEARWWAVPLAVLGELAGGFPARRILYGETGSFLQYLGRTVRFLVAIAGFWFVLALAPVLIAASAELAPAVAVLFTVGLALWAIAEDAVVRLALGVGPLDRPDLEPSMAAVLDRAGLVERPTLHLLPARGGRWANAIAVTSRSRPAVIFSRGLLDLLDERETSAILAHEIAHLEHWHRARTTRRIAIQVALAAIGAFAVPPAALMAGSFAWVVLALWPLALLIGLLVRASRHQAHETESDRRAVELCADAEALVSALTKLHAAARLPSRWEREMERSASHPSLARRVRAIRSAAGGEAEADSASLLVRSTEAGRFVLLEGERVTWLDGVAAGVEAEPTRLREAAKRSRTIALDELSDLRVRAGLTTTATLVAVDRRGDSWSVPIRGEDVAPLQRALDALDHRLRPGSSSPWLHPAPAAILALLVMIGSLLAGPMSASMIAALLALQTSTVALAACGVAALAEATRLAAQPIDVMAPLRGLGVLVLAAAGAAAILLTMARVRHEEVVLRLRRIHHTVLALAAAALLVWLIGLAALGFEPSRFLVHQVAQALPGATTLSLALAAALALWPRGAARAGAAAALLLGLLPAIAASSWFSASVVRDPFSVAGMDVAVDDHELEPVARIPLPFPTSDLRLTPSGELYAARPSRFAPEDEEGNVAAWPPFRLGPEPAAAGEIAAVDLALVDERRALVLRAAGSGLEIALLDVAKRLAPEWRLAIPDAATGTIDVDEASGAWRFAGTSRDTRAAVSIAGSIGGGGVAERRWPLDDSSSETGYETVVASPAGALFLRASFDMTAPAALMPILGLAAIERRTDLRFWPEGSEGSRPLARSAFDLSCTAPWLAEARAPLLCLAHDGRSTFLWAIHPSDGRREPLGRLEGRHFVLGRAGEGRIVTWADAREVAVVDLRAGSARRLAAVRGAGLVTAFAGDTLGTVSPGTDEIEIYDLAAAR